MNLLLLLEISFFGLIGLVSFAIVASFVYYSLKNKKKIAAGEVMPAKTEFASGVITMYGENNLPENRAHSTFQQNVLQANVTGERTTQDIMTQAPAIFNSPVFSISEPRFVVLNSHQSSLYGNRKPEYAELIKFK